MKIYCIGNAAVVGDDIPALLLPYLKKEFPEYEILSVDPTESLIPEPDSLLLDTVEGIKHVSVYSDIDDFVTTKSVSVHDYDLGLHMQLLKKIHRLPHIRIIGIPLKSIVDTILTDVFDAIRKAISEMKTTT